MNARPALAAALLAGAALVAPHDAWADTAIRARYLCQGRPDATSVTALFFNQTPSAVVLLAGREGAIRLAQQPAGSGARYSDGNDTFWIKGDQAIWTRGRAPAITCQASPGGVSSDSPAPTR